MWRVKIHFTDFEQAYESKQRLEGLIPEHEEIKVGFGSFTLVTDRPLQFLKSYYEDGFTDKVEITCDE